MNMTAVNRLLTTLKAGERLTAKQISARFGVKNSHNLVYELRNQGYAVYLNRHTDSKGRTTQKYRLGTPTRSMVSLAYRTMTVLRDIDMD